VILSAVPALVLAVAIAQASPAAPSPPPNPSPTASAAASAAPSAAPSPSPTATPVAFNYIVDFPTTAAGAPGIREVAVTEQALHSGGPWVMRVTTTADITAVAVEAYGLRFSLFPIGATGSGVFAAMGTLPNAPASYLNRTYAVTVVGTTADGRRATASVSLQLVR
jgi:hypothetical protein